MKTPDLKRMRRSQQGAVTVKGIVILVAVLILVPVLVVGFTKVARRIGTRR